MRKIIIIGTLHAGLTPEKELKKVLENNKIRKSMITNGLKRGRTLTWKYTASQVIKVYNINS